MNQQFHKWLGERIESYEAARERGLKAYRTRCMKIGEDLNHDVPPNSSSAGLHAPFDGYHWETDETCRNYLKGQFLPWPMEDEYNRRLLGGFTDGTKRIDNVPLKRAELFIEGYNSLPETQRKTVSIYHGDSWTPKYTYYTGRKVEEYCHVYLSKCPADLEQAIRDYLMGDIHKLQRLAEQKTEDEKAARDKAHEEGEDVIEGRQVINGVVLAIKRQESEWGSVLKMLVQDDRGFRVWGTVPSSLDTNREDHITFTATVTQSDKDTKFGFFKRPAKAQVNDRKEKE